MVIISSKAGRSPNESEGRRRQQQSIEEIEQYEAATKLQATFRGRKARQEVADLRESKVQDEQAEKAKQDSEQKKEVVFQKKVVFNRQSSSSKGSESDSRRPSKSDPHAAFRHRSAGTANLNDGSRTLLQGRETIFPPHIQSARISVFLLVEEPTSSRAAMALSLAILAAILFSIMIFVLETVKELKAIIAPEVWFGLELGCTLVFTLEYLTRLSVCTVTGTTVSKWVRRPMNIIDVMAIIPFYAWLLMQNIKIGKAFSVLRLVRLVRLFRVLKLSRYSSGLRLMTKALVGSSQALWVLSFFVGIGVVLFSSLIYFIEKSSCPDRDELRDSAALDPGRYANLLDQYVQECRNPSWKSKNFEICCNEDDSPLAFPTIIEAFWWAAVTMTTVGFGDLVPSTSVGKMAGTVTMLSGILLVALPIAIIGRKFQEAYEENAAANGYVSPKAESKELEGTLTDIAKRVRRMRFQDSYLSTLARDLAENLDEVSMMQQEIRSTQNEEFQRQKILSTQFCEVLDHFIQHADDPRNAKGGLAWKKKKQQTSDPAYGSSVSGVSPKKAGRTAASAP